MMGLLAWLVVFWAISLPYNVYVIGNEYDGWGEVVSQILVVIFAWIIANKAERAVNRYLYAKREANRG